MNHDRLADAAGAVAGLSFLGITLADWNAILQVLVGVVGICSGLGAAAYYWLKWWRTFRGPQS